MVTRAFGLQSHSYAELFWALFARVYSPLCRGNVHIYKNFKCLVFFVFFFSTLSAKLNKLYSFNSLEKKVSAPHHSWAEWFYHHFWKTFPQYTSQLTSYIPVKLSQGFIVKKKEKRMNDLDILCITHSYQANEVFKACAIPSVGLANEKYYFMQQKG